MPKPKLFPVAILAFSFLLCSCGAEDKRAADDTLVKGVATKEEMVRQGRSLVTVGGCNDCHSPKKMTPHGPVIDSTRMLSGHPANSALPPVIASALKPGNWYLMAPDVTAFVGPWGISYAANLTSDSATGIGAWTEHQFIQTMRTGKHLGMAGGRPILPPMPYENLAQMSDEELKAILAFLKSTTPIANRVPAPVPPDQAAAK